MITNNNIKLARVHRGAGEAFLVFTELELKISVKTVGSKQALASEAGLLLCAAKKKKQSVKRRRLEPNL